MSPIKTLLNTRGARGADSVRQIQNTIDGLTPQPAAKDATTAAVTTGNDAQSASIIAFELMEEKVSLPLGWLLSDISRCDMQQQISSVVSGQCQPGTMQAAKVNKEKIQKIVAMLTKSH
jgi:hypothetical protein